MSVIFRLLFQIAALLSAGFLLSCAQEDEGEAPPLATTRYPSGIALTPEGGALPQRLLVVSSNFDLRYRSGVLHAFDREELDRLVDEAPPGEGCPEALPRCTPARIPDLGSALAGAVEIGDYGGQVAAIDLGPGRQRAFVPIRSTGKVIAVELDGGAEALRCAEGGGTDCRGTGASFARQDPFSIAVALGNVYVGHSTSFRNMKPRGGVIGMAFADAAFWTGGGGALGTIRVGDTAIGGLAVGGCSDGDEGAQRCTLYASGRSTIGNSQPIFAFDFEEGVWMSSPLFSRNLYAQEKGFDSRGIAVSSSGKEVYFASHAPDALGVVDVTRLATLPSDACLIPEGDVVAPGAACPDLPTPSEDAPRFMTADLLPSPKGPNVVVTVQRDLPDGSVSDLVVVTTSSSLAFYDTRSGSFVGELGGLGGAPSDLAIRPSGGGYRLYVPSFSQGTIAVVDLPDPFRPESASVVAILGERQGGQL